MDCPHDPLGTYLLRTPKSDLLRHGPELMELLPRNGYFLVTILVQFKAGFSAVYTFEKRFSP